MTTGQPAGHWHLTFADLELRERTYFLKELRSARYKALEDAEDFVSICFVLEELGRRLYVRPPGNPVKIPTGLGQCADVLEGLIPKDGMERTFSGNLERLRQSRNDKAHQGVYARNTVAKAVAVSVALEEILMTHVQTIADIMVESVVYAEPFMPLSKIRELMLAHSFSHLPYRPVGSDEYYLISDVEVARRWQTLNNDEKKKTAIRELIDAGQLTLAKGMYAELDDEVALASIPGAPQLVQDDEGNVLGIVSAFDWL